MYADPAATAAMAPVEEIVATAVLLLAQVMLPVITRPEESRRVAVACPLLGTVSWLESTAMATDATVAPAGAFATVSCALPHTLLIFAPIVTDPGATATMTPVEEMVAIVVSDDRQVVVNPLTTLPWLSSATA
jgi:hypothetical protein